MNTVGERDEIIALLRQAVERDPNYAGAHAFLAYFLCMSVTTMFSRKPDEDIAEALRHVDRALSLDRGNPMVTQAAAYAHRLFGDEALALDLAERATAMVGMDSMFGQRGGTGLFASLIQAGRAEEAIELMLATRPKPERPLCWAYAALGNWPEALTWAQRLTTTNPNDYLAWTYVANAMAMNDRLDEAKQIMRKVMAMVPTLTLAYYEKGMRIAWRNREKIVDSQLAGLRRLEMT